MCAVLIVNAYESFRHMAGFILRDSGYDVVEVGVAGEALRKLEEEQIDLILSDDYLPDSDIFDFVRDIRDHDHGKSLPVIVTTAGCDDEWKQKGLEAGVNGWLETPINPAHLLAVLRFVLHDLKAKGQTP